MGRAGECLQERMLKKKKRKEKSDNTQQQTIAFLTESKESLSLSLSCSYAPFVTPGLEQYYRQVNLEAVLIEQHLPSCE